MVIAIVVHPLCKIGGEGFLRASAVDGKKPSHLSGGSLFCFEATFSFIGRCFINGTRDPTKTATAILIVGVQEIFARTQRLRIMQFLRKLQGREPLTGEKLERFLSIMALDERQDATVEICNIISTTVMYIWLWGGFRWIFDIGFQDAVNRDSVSLITGLGAFQFFGETLAIDPFCIWSHQRNRIEMPNPWKRKGRCNLAIAREGVQAIMGMTMSLAAFHLIPLSGICKSANICECDFTKTLDTLIEHCCAVEEGGG